MSFISIKESEPPKYESFMAWHSVSGEMFVQFWISNELNNFMVNDTKFTHWQIIANDNNILRG